MLTIIEAPDQPASSDASRVFASLQAASGGLIRVVEGDEERAEDLRAAGQQVLLDARLVEPGEQLPRLKTGLASPDSIALEAGIDGRLRRLPLQPREEEVVRLITPLAISEANGFAAGLALMEALDARGCPWHWYILGRPEDESFFETWTEALEASGIAGEVTLVGEYSLEMFLRLATNMDFAFFPNARRGLDVTLLDALQLGLPILSRDSERLVPFADEQGKTIFVWDGIGADAAVDFFLGVRGQAETRRVTREFAGLESYRDLAKKLLSGL